MPSTVRVGTGRAGARGLGSRPAQTYPGTTSAYGATRGDSVGYNPANPHAYLASQNAKAYTSGAKNAPLTPPIKGTE